MMALSSTPPPTLSSHHHHHHNSGLPLSTKTKFRSTLLIRSATTSSSSASSAAATTTGKTRKKLPPSPSSASTYELERVFFDGGAHYGDLITNLLLGFTLLWLPLTTAAVLRAFFLRYRFTSLRVSVVSGLTGGDRFDFPYKAIKDVKTVPRLFGEWGDVVIELTDGTKVDLRSVPKFREIADYCIFMATEEEKEKPKFGGGGGGRGGGVNSNVVEERKKPRGI